MWNGCSEGLRLFESLYHRHLGRCNWHASWFIRLFFASPFFPFLLLCLHCTRLLSCIEFRQRFVYSHQLQSFVEPRRKRASRITEIADLPLSPQSLLNLLAYLLMVTATRDHLLCSRRPPCTWRKLSPFRNICIATAVSMKMARRGWAACLFWIRRPLSCCSHQKWLVLFLPDDPVMSKRHSLQTSGRSWMTFWLFTLDGMRKRAPLAGFSASLTSR